MGIVGEIENLIVEIQRKELELAALKRRLQELHTLSPEQTQQIYTRLLTEKKS